MQLVFLATLAQLWLCLVHSNAASLPGMATKKQYVEINGIRGGMAGLKPLQASIVSWNMAEKAPTEDSCSFIKLYRDDDIDVFGIQECENIRPRRNEGHRSRKWRSIQSKMLGRTFRCIARHKMGGLLLAVYVRKNLSKEIEGLQISDVACGVGNVLTNKGAVSVVLRIRDKTIALINSHLAAHQSHVKQRNADYTRIMDAVMESIPTEWKARRETNQQDEAHSRDDGGDRAFSSQHPPKPLTLLGKRKSPLKTLTSHFSTITTKTRKTYKAPVGKTKAPPRRVQNVRRAEEIPIDAVLFFGDLNYRLERPRQEIEGLHKQLLKNSAVSTKIRLRSSEASLEGINLGGVRSEEQTTVSNRSTISNNYFKHTPADQKILLESKLDRLLRFDQLNQQRRFGKVLKGFSEGNIRFPPTYKYDKGADLFDTSAKQRCPAWTDRILFYTRASDPSKLSEYEGKGAAVVHSLTSGLSELPEALSAVATSAHISRRASAEKLGSSIPASPAPSEEEGDKKEVVELIDYYSVDVRTSDHRPVCATFRLNLQ